MFKCAEKMTRSAHSSALRPAIAGNLTFDLALHALCRWMTLTSMLSPLKLDDWGGFVWLDPDGFAERVIADFLGAK
jgi:hypothetical protein